jgi:alpha-1,3-rhamnosyl/mannosyltransferase
VKVLLDARAIASPLHGIARYGWSLLHAYAADPGPFRFHVILGPGPLPGTFDAPPHMEVERVGVAPYGIAEQWRMPPVLARVRCDLNHTLTYTAPLAQRHPLVLSIFDLIHLRYPQEYSRIHPLYYRHVVRPLVRRARAVVTLSEASKHDLVALLGADPERVHVTPLAAEPRFAPQPPEAIARVCAAHDLAPGYLLHLSNYRGHKNAEGVAHAFARLRKEGTRVSLVLAGNPPPVFRAWLDREGIADGVRMLRHVDDADLPTLYAGARAFVFPSRCEGFGLPPLEAMACGTPVIVSNVSSLPEVIGDAGLFVDPEDPAAIARAMADLISDDALHADLSARGRARAALFSWERVARETKALYERVCGMRTRSPNA